MESFAISTSGWSSQEDLETTRSFQPGIFAHVKSRTLESPINSISGNILAEKTGHQIKVRNEATSEPSKRLFNDFISKTKDLYYKLSKQNVLQA